MRGHRVGVVLCWIAALACEPFEHHLEPAPSMGHETFDVKVTRPDLAFREWSPHFLVHFDDASHRQLALAILADLEYVHDNPASGRNNLARLNALGLRLPRDDSRCTDPGPDRRLDLYLVDSRDAYGTTSRCSGRVGEYAGGFVLVPASAATVSATVEMARHELMHLVQLEYAESPPDWVREGSADWVSQYVMTPPATLANVHSIGFSTYWQDMKASQHGPQKRLDTPAGPPVGKPDLTMRARAQFFRFLAESEGERFAVGKVIELLRRPPTATDAEAVFGLARFRELVARYFLWGSFTGTSAAFAPLGAYRYKEASLFDELAVAREHGPNYPTHGHEDLIGAYGAKLVRFLPPPPPYRPGDVLRFRFSSPFVATAWVIAFYGGRQGPPHSVVLRLGHGLTEDVPLRDELVAVHLVGVVTDRRAEDTKGTFEYDVTRDRTLPPCADPGHVGVCFYRIFEREGETSYVGHLAGFPATRDQCTQANVDRQPTYLEWRRASPDLFAEPYGWDLGRRAPCRQRATDTRCSGPAENPCSAHSTWVDEVSDETYRTRTECEYLKAPGGPDALWGCTPVGAWPGLRCFFADRCEVFDGGASVCFEWTWMEDADVGLCGHYPDVVASPDEFVGSLEPMTLPYCDRIHSDRSFCAEAGAGPNCREYWFAQDTSDEPGCR